MWSVVGGSGNAPDLSGMGTVAAPDGGSGQQNTAVDNMGLGVLGGLLPLGGLPLLGGNVIGPATPAPGLSQTTAFNPFGNFLNGGSGGGLGGAATTASPPNLGLTGTGLAWG